MENSENEKCEINEIEYAFAQIEIDGDLLTRKYLVIITISCEDYYVHSKDEVFRSILKLLYADY